MHIWPLLKPGDPTVERQPDMERLWAAEARPIPWQRETSRPNTGEPSIMEYFLILSFSFRALQLDILRWANRHFQVYPRPLKITRTIVRVSWVETWNLDQWSVKLPVSLVSAPSGLSVTSCVFETMPKSWYYSCDTPSGKLICTAFIAIHSRYLIFKLINTQLI